VQHYRLVARVQGTKLKSSHYGSIAALSHWFSAVPRAEIDHPKIRSAKPALQQDDFFSLLMRQRSFDLRALANVSET
jgi:hypothetical protein